MTPAVRSSVLALALSTLAAPLPAQAGGQAGIRGTITDAAGRPLAGAMVLRLGSADTARADSAGRFAVERLALGRHLFTVRKDGFEPVDMEVTFTSDTTISVDIPLEVARGGAYGGAGKLESVGFTRRRQAERRATYFAADEIASSGAVRLSQLLEGVRDVHVRIENSIPVLYGFDRRCVMRVFLEGRIVDNAFPPAGSGGGSSRRATVRYTGLDEIIGFTQLAGVEVYPRPSMVPDQFQRSQQVSTSRDMDTRTEDCGALILWTR